MAELQPIIVFHGRHFVRHFGICNPICVKLLKIMSSVIPCNLKKEMTSLSQTVFLASTNVHTHTHALTYARTHTRPHARTHTHTHTHDDSKKRNAKQCILPKNLYIAITNKSNFMMTAVQVETFLSLHKRILKFLTKINWNEIKEKLLKTIPFDRKCVKLYLWQQYQLSYLSPFTKYLQSKCSWPCHWPLEWSMVKCKYAYQKPKLDFLFGGNSNIHPICQRLWDITNWNEYDLDLSK